MLFGALRVPLDALAVFTALVLSYRLRAAQIDLIPGVQLLEPAQTLPPFPAYVSTFVTLGIVIFVVTATLLGLYAFRATASAWREIGRIILATAVWLVLVMAWYFLIRRELFYSRVLLAHSALFMALFVTVLRASLTLFHRALLRVGWGRRAVISIGKMMLPEGARDTLQHDIRYRYLGHVKSFREIETLGRREDIDLLLQTDPHPRDDETLSIIEYCRSQHVGYAFLPPVLADAPHQLEVERLGLLPLLTFRPTPLDGWGRIAKRCFDVAMSALLLVALLPFFILVGLIVLALSGWPILYISKRIGSQGRGAIHLCKFRSMVRDADARKDALLARNHRRDGPLFKVKRDPRVTVVGHVLRRWSIDEWPQLWNVLNGDLSLVGPRPHLPEEVSRYTPFQRRVFAVKPGVTGLAQISGRSDLSFEEEVRLDLQYIEEWSLLLDLWILWRTVFVVIGKKGAD